MPVPPRITLPPAHARTRQGTEECHLSHRRVSATDGNACPTVGAHVSRANEAPAFAQDRRCEILENEGPVTLTPSYLVSMRVMQIRCVRMRMDQSAVLVAMGVRLTDRITGAVLMRVVFVVRVWVGVLNRLVDVLMLMVLAEMQPDAESHEKSGRRKLYGDRLG